MNDLKELIRWDQIDDPPETPFGQLVNMMSELSEDHICATWIADCEYYLWELANNPGKWSNGVWSIEITTDIARTLLGLSIDCKGWPVPRKEGLELCPMNEWIERFEIWKSCIQKKKT